MVSPLCLCVAARKIVRRLSLDPWQPDASYLWFLKEKDETRFTFYDTVVVVSCFFIYIYTGILHCFVHSLGCKFPFHNFPAFFKLSSTLDVKRH